MWNFNIGRVWCRWRTRVNLRRARRSWMRSQNSPPSDNRVKIVRRWWVLQWVKAQWLVVWNRQLNLSWKCASLRGGNVRLCWLISATVLWLIDSRFPNVVHRASWFYNVQSTTNILGKPTPTSRFSEVEVSRVRSWKKKIWTDTFN
jgi:hypothetical protein